MPGYLPHSNAPSAIFLGSNSNEATHRAKGAFQVPDWLRIVPAAWSAPFVGWINAAVEFLRREEIFGLRRCQSKSA